MPIATGRATDLITFSRGTLATVTDANGRIVWAPHNLLLASEQFDASSWTRPSATVTANAGVAPNGTTTADLLTISAQFGGVNQFVSLQSGVSYTLSFWAKVNTGTNTYSVVDNSGGAGIIATFTPTTSWVQYTFTFTAASGSATLFPANDRNASGFGSIYLWGAHLYRADLGGMQANASAYPLYNPSTAKNLLGYSEAFDNAAFTKSNMLAFGSGSVANAVAAPNGSLSADLLVPNTTNGGHSVYQAATVGGLNTQSIYVKAAGYSKVALRESWAGGYYASFDISAGTVLASSNCTAAIMAAGDGWYRISIIGSVVGTTWWSLLFLDPSYTTGSPTGSWTPNGTSGIYLWGAQLSDSASLDAYSPVFGAAPSAAAAHGPRLDYSSSGSALGLLVEEQRTNLLQRSQELAASPWSANQSAVTADNGIAPDGTTTADLLASSGAGSFPALSQTVSGSGTITFSAYVKDGTSGQVIFRVTGVDVGGAGNTEAVYRFTFSTALFTRQQGGTGTTTVQSLANGWYRIALTLTTTSYSSVIFYPRWSDATIVNVLLWGAQLEAGSFATSYIPTAAATVTRNADLASVGVSQFPHSSTEGTWVANFQTIVTGGVPLATTILNYDATGTRLPLYIGQGAQIVGSYDGTTIIGSGVDATGQVTKAAVAYTTSERAISAQGSSVVTGASTSGFASASTINFGTTGSGLINGWFRQITYIPRRLANAELQSRTA